MAQLSQFSLRPSLIRRELLLQLQELLPRLPQLLVKLGPGLAQAGDVRVVAGDDPGSRGSQVGIWVDHAGDEIVEILRVPAEVLEGAPLYVLVVRVVRAVPGQNSQAGRLVDCQSETEDVRLGELAGVGGVH